VPRLRDRPNFKAPWTEEQIATLKRKLAAGETIREIAAEMGRSQEAVRGKAWKVGLLAERKRAGGDKMEEEPRTLEKHAAQPEDT